MLKGGVADMSTDNFLSCSFLQMLQVDILRLIILLINEVVNNECDLLLVYQIWPVCYRVTSHGATVSNELFKLYKTYL